MKNSLVQALLILLVVAGVIVAVDQANKTGDAAATKQAGTFSGLPWQIQLNARGDTEVFGLAPGYTTIAEAIMRLGDEFEAAVIIDSDDQASLEVYFAHYKAGPLKGRLVLGAFSDNERLKLMAEQATDSDFMDSAARKFVIATEVITRSNVIIETLTFIPGANLDDDIIRNRFGAPENLLVINEETSHYQYPSKGLDIALHSDAKDVLQYVHPTQFKLLAVSQAHQ